MKEAWIPPHNAQVRLTQNVLRLSNEYLISVKKLKNYQVILGKHHCICFSLCLTREVAQTEQRAGYRAAEAVLQVREFELCSNEYHHLLGSEVTGNFCSDCMRFAGRNTPLSTTLLLRHTARLGPCGHTHFLCQVTRRYFFFFSLTVAVLAQLDLQGYTGSCVDNHCQCVFELTDYYNVIKIKTAKTSRCFPVTVPIRALR